MSKITFKQLDLLPNIQRALDELGFTSPTEIQEKAIPLIRTGIDIIGRSQTGTGKTLAFSLPITEIIEPSDNKKSSPQALILCPTRELAMQVSEVIKKITKHSDHIFVTEVYGGASLDKQFAQLRKANIVIGTPGRVMDHMRRGTLLLNNVKMVILDEADEMLSMGFKEDIETILIETPAERQTILFSATMPPGIMSITKEFQDNPKMLVTKTTELAVTNITQSYVEVPSNQKFEALDILLYYYEPKLAIIFCNTKKMAEELTGHLNSVGIEADGLHGDLRQSQRTNVMNRFKYGKTSILVATDVAARGIDVDDVEYVFNFDLPQNYEYYIHRIGRTGRVGKSGNAITLCTSRRQINTLLDIAHRTKSKIATMPLPSFSEIVNKSSIGSLSAMRRALAEKSMPKYTEMLNKLQDEGYKLEEIAISAMALCFAENDAMRSSLKPVQMDTSFSYSNDKRNNRKKSYNSSSKRSNKTSTSNRKKQNNTEKKYNSKDSKASTYDSMNNPERKDKTTRKSKNMSERMNNKKTKKASF